MKKIIAVVAVLAMASMANAAVLSVGPTAGVLEGEVVQIPILVSGGETIIAITANVSVEAGSILSYNPKAGVLAGSTNVVDEPYIFDNLTGDPAAAGSQLATAVYSDYSMAFGQSTTANGVAGILTVSTVGLAPGTYAVNLETLFGPTLVDNAPAETSTAGSFTVLVPEPASLMLLGLGGLFLRRRHA